MEAAALDEAGVHDVHNAVDGQRGLGDVGREDHLPKMEGWADDGGGGGGDDDDDVSASFVATITPCACRRARARAP